MINYRKFIVETSLPEKLKPLETISYNLWWAWNPNAINLLRRIDGELWDKMGHNPIKVLGSISQLKIKELEEDEGFITHMNEVLQELNDYMKGETWFHESCKKNWKGNNHIGYFSLEFGIDECLPIYSGGLGVLAGDHLKSASDLGLPLSAMGLAYSHGYFTQYLNQDGWQQEVYPDNLLHLLPLRLVNGEDGKPLKVAVPYPDRNIYTQVWKATVGRIELFLLDTNIPENSDEDRGITSQLYGGDINMRMKQEVLLGVGGVLAFKAMGKDISVFHMNEGHSAFLGLARIARMIKEKGFDFFAAKEACISSTIFTTHTPVPAGNDMFDVKMLRPYIESIMQGVDYNMEKVISLGRVNPNDDRESFCMTVLALRLSAASNGVSKLHGEVSRNMWQDIWKGLPQNLIPIHSVTNGIHIRSWISSELHHLFDRYIGKKWLSKPGDDTIWAKIDKIPDAELWRMHERRRERLVSFARKRAVEQLKNCGASEAKIKVMEEILDPEALTIGFARRFATYKRGTLILKDIKRLAAMLNSKEQPVQMVFAGKAHPKDMEGKNLIKEIIHVAREEGLQSRLLFIENYDIDVARYLVQGCDIWLNNPRRPLEASGTSGMKAAVNGVVNLSVLDGWWDEGYEPETGWAIGAGEGYDDHQVQDAVEGKALYEILEQDIIPLFYNRGTDGLPRGWIKKMKSSMKKLTPVYNTNRMVREYTEQFYMGLADRWEENVIQNPDTIKELAEWKLRMKNGWSGIQVTDVSENGTSGTSVGKLKPITAVVHSGSISTDELKVECYYGTMSSSGELIDAKFIEMSVAETLDDGRKRFTADIPCDNAGLHGFAIRVLPYNKNMVTRYIPSLITWG